MLLLDQKAVSHNLLFCANVSISYEVCRKKGTLTIYDSIIIRFTYANVLQHDGVIKYPKFSFSLLFYYRRVRITMASGSRRIAEVVKKLKNYFRYNAFYNLLL